MLQQLLITSVQGLLISSRGIVNEANLRTIARAVNGSSQQDESQILETKQIYLLSDGTGATLKQSIEKSLKQFSTVDKDVQTRLFSFIRGEEAAARIIQKAKQRDAMLFTTVANPVLQIKIQRMSELSNVPLVDLLGPSLDGLSHFLGQSPAGQPLKFSSMEQNDNKRATLGNAYYRRIEAVEFTLNADDGQRPWLLKEADVILVGVSRSGKTPLSVVLSQQLGLKVANVPLVQEVPIPKELLDVQTIDPQRVFCLTIAPSELKRIRNSRLERSRVKEMEESTKSLLRDEESSTISNYADRNYIMKDLMYANDLVLKYNWTKIDVTGRAVEETASYISELMNERQLIVQNE